MITVKHYGAALGFAFVATWIGLGFGAAILCLLGAWPAMGSSRSSRVGSTWPS